MLKLGVFVLLCAMAGSVVATDKPHPPMPVVKEPAPLKGMPEDNWGGAKAHVAVSAVFGAAARTFVTKDPIKAWGIAMVPGLVREIDTYYNKPEPGYRHGLFSTKDLIANGVGAAIGVYTGGIIVDKTGDKYRLSYFRSF